MYTHGWKCPEWSDTPQTCGNYYDLSGHIHVCAIEKKGRYTLNRLSQCKYTLDRRSLNAGGGGGGGGGGGFKSGVNPVFMILMRTIIIYLAVVYYHCIRWKTKSNPLCAFFFLLQSVENQNYCSPGFHMFMIYSLAIRGYICSCLQLTFPVVCIESIWYAAHLFVDV